MCCVHRVLDCWPTVLRHVGSVGLWVGVVFRKSARGAVNGLCQSKGWSLLEFLYLAGGSKQHILAVIDVVESAAASGLHLSVIVM